MAYEIDKYLLVVFFHLIQLNFKSAKYKLNFFFFKALICMLSGHYSAYKESLKRIEKEKNSSCDKIVCEQSFH